MKRALVLQHVEFEGPGRVAALLADRGYAVEIRRLYAGEMVPERLAAGEVLVVMGGPMGVGDLDDPAFPFLRAEVLLLRRCIEADVPVLGICLGAQLLAHAAGAEVGRMLDEGGGRVFEVGWGKVRANPESASNALLDGLPGEFDVLHWHGDAFAVPAGAALLLSTDVCRSQAFVLGSRQIGLQFHAECGPEDVETFLREDGDFVVLANGPRGVEELRRETRERASLSKEARERLLENIVERLTGR